MFDLRIVFQFLVYELWFVPLVRLFKKLGNFVSFHNLKGFVFIKKKLQLKEFNLHVQTSTSTSYRYNIACQNEPQKTPYGM